MIKKILKVEKSFWHFNNLKENGKKNMWKYVLTEWFIERTRLPAARSSSIKPVGRISFFHQGGGAGHKIKTWSKNVVLAKVVFYPYPTPATPPLKKWGMNGGYMNSTWKHKLFSIIGFSIEFFPSSFWPIGVEIIHLCTWWPWDQWVWWSQLVIQSCSQS